MIKTACSKFRKQNHPNNTLLLTWAAFLSHFRPVLHDLFEHRQKKFFLSDTRSSDDLHPQKEAIAGISWPGGQYSRDKRGTQKTLFLGRRACSLCTSLPRRLSPGLASFPRLPPFFIYYSTSWPPQNTICFC